MKSVSNFSDVEVYFAIRDLDPDLDKPHTVTAGRCVLRDHEKTVVPAPLPAAQWIKVAVTMLVCAVVMFSIAAAQY